MQTPTLAILVDRALEILAHVPRPYWQLEGRFRAGDHEYAGTWFDPEFRAPEGEERENRDDRIFDEARANRLIETTRGASAVASETRKPTSACIMWLATVDSWVEPAIRASVNTTMIMAGSASEVIRRV